MFGKSLTYYLISTIFILFSSSCSLQKKQDKKHHWGYVGEFSVKKWGDHPSFEICKTGTKQSPINLTADLIAKDSDLEFYYNDAEFDLINNGHAVMAIPNSYNYLHYNGIRYQLLNFHMHATSEHTIEHIRYPMEFHLVHKFKDKLLVVSILVKEGREHSHLNKMLDNYVLYKKNQKIDKELDPIVLIPDNFEIYAYEGSLTTPPCTEGVQWIIFKTPIELSKKQIDEFRNDYRNNSRPIQKR
jgi:carbonic anhydrase